ncbi:hypothetical protein Cni_G20535 [Canna indica]|uniref:HMA domain-containing protein n=1 Tax=Canna indica TaxID=4628 RepID=A0AAQ3KTD4_9LILI|nr:hypothetical protein Cni_G20535 [Canna indica]
MLQKIVLSVSIMCSKCKISIMTTISKFDGVVSISLDAEKGTVTVLGTVDVVCMVKALRKAKRPAKVLSVGEPEKKEEKKEEKKDEKKEEAKPLPACCRTCSTKIVLSVSIMCSKCKISIMTTISKFDGVVSISLDAEKGTVTVLGTVDVVCMVKALRKAKRPAKVLSVGEPEKEEKKEEKKDEKKEEAKPLPACCRTCSTVVVWTSDEPNGCSIL